MISVVVYGRNDSHGYNLHRRAALSLNCIAEVLTDFGDEIVFVDYNTPDELPTFVEAIADTLTDRCLDLLRVFRVPAALHAERFAARTHLPAIEPVARNAGVRRANPANRWILSTNTDMLFVPLFEGSLSEICADAPDGFYGLPRFELPEWLWERLPRTDPRRALAEVERLGPRLRLDEPTLSNEWIRFDAPGDFQLILREDWFAIDGLDEEMILGYHVDSNLSKRMLIQRGAIDSLEESVAGYHCNHNREPTVYHGAEIVANDLRRFFLLIERPDLPAQRTTWGLPDVTLEEVAVRERAGTAFATALEAAIPDAAPPQPSDAGLIPYGLAYDSGHVLPFVAESLAVSRPDTRIGYLGANPVLERMLVTVVERLGFSEPLEIAEPDDEESVERLAQDTDVFVVDLGLDATLVDIPVSADSGQAQLPPSVARVLDALDALVGRERERLEAGEHPRRFVLVHSWTVFWDSYVVANFDCSHMTAHSRVRRATVRPAPPEEWTPEPAQVLFSETRAGRWAARGNAGERRLELAAGETVETAELADFGGFGEGWAFPEEAGVWTQGTRSELAVALTGVGEHDCVLELGLGSICVAQDSLLKVAALVNGERFAARDFRFGDTTWRMELTRPGSQDGALDFVFELDGLTTPIALGWSAEDERPLGLLFRTLSVETLDRRVRTDEKIAFTEASGAGRLLGSGWSWPEPTGVWTDGAHATVILQPEPDRGNRELVLTFDAFLTPAHCELEVELSSSGELLWTGALRYSRVWQLGRLRRRLRVPLPTASDETGRLELELHVKNPASPLELGLSEDDRRLGLHLRSLELRRGRRPAASSVSD